MCDIGGGETPKIFNEHYPKSRKEHICCECGSIIKKGERYQNCSGLWDDFETYKTCSFCAKIRVQAQTDKDLDESFPFGQLWECVGMDYAK
jgi:hypothetical protein